MNTRELCQRVSDFASHEVSCFDAPDDAVGCNLPIAYPDGGYVTVYVSARNGVWEVTDRGEGYMEVLGRYTPDFKQFSKTAQQICESHGVEFADGQVLAAAKDESLVLRVWSVGRAATRVAEAVTFYRPRKRRAEVEPAVETFADEVAIELKQRRVPLERKVPIVGASGHQHTASIYVPQREAIIEPLHPSASFRYVSETYAKFGDIQRVNGFQRFAVIDDRTNHPTADIVRLLRQVGEVVEWTEREPWLVALT